ncbi:MAG: hypothetical protein HFJ20_02105 [Clostridia bacterium]|nr:hypothetical protein [Clostridia bacterium]
MWQNSNELFNYTLRELKKAVKNGESELDIVLEEKCPRDDNKMNEICERLKIKAITEQLRNKFCNYDIKSDVHYSNVLFITYKTGCDFGATIEWTLTISPK